MSFKKRRISDETRRKMSEALKGKTPWNKGKKGVMSSGKDHPMYGKKHTEESKRKMSKANKGKTPWMKGKKHSEEAKRKSRLANLGKKASEETKRKLRGRIPWNKGTKGISKSNSGSFKKGQIAHNKWKKHTEESKRKMSIAHKKTWEDPSFRKRQTETHLGKKLTEEQKRKIGLALKGRKRPADVIEKIRLANIGKKRSEEAKRKNSEAKKKLYASGFQVWNKGKMGVMPDPWNKGIPMKEESKRKMAESHKYSIYPKTDSKPEKSLQALLTDGGIKFEKHKLFRTSGRPYFHKTDLFIEPNICIEVDSEYHHASPNVKNSDGSMKYPDNFVIWKAYKSAKEKTAGHIRAKDERITKEMEQQGNTVIRFWTNELHKNPEKCLQKIIEAIKEARK